MPPPDVAVHRDEAWIEELPVAIARLDPCGLVAEVNPAFLKLAVRETSDVAGRPLDLELIYPEDRHLVTSALRDAHNGLAASVCVRLRKDTCLIRADLRFKPGADGSVFLVLIEKEEQDALSAALLESESLYQTFLEQGPVGVIHVDSVSLVTFENHRFRTIVGESAEASWIGRDLARIEGIDGRLAELVRQMLATGESFGEVDLSFQRVDGVLRTLAFHGTAIRHPEEGVVGGALMVSDVTEARDREQELRLRRRYDVAEAALRSAALSSASDERFLEDIAAVFGDAAGADHVFVLIRDETSGSFEEEARWAKETERSLVPVRLSGDRLSDLLRGDVLFHAPAFQFGDEVAGSSSREVTGLAITTAGRACLILLSRQPETEKWADTELHALQQLAALLDTLLGWRNAEARYREVVTAIEDSLFTYGFDSPRQRAYSFVTRQIAVLTGCDADELVSGAISWIDDVVHPEDQPAVEAFHRELQEGRDGRLVYRVRHRDGRVRWLRESASSTRDTIGRVVVGGILSDVTDQKSIEASLIEAKQDAEAANRMKSSFLATMSHELRTPLGAIKGFAELLDEEVSALESASAEVVEFTGVIRANAGRALRLVNDLLDLARLQTERLALARTPVSLNPLLEAAAARYHAVLAEKGVQLQTELATPPPIVQADAGRIEQVLEILLSNATKFTEHGTVMIRSNASDGVVSFCVEDSGIGIDESYICEIFEPFTQEDHRLNRAYEGSGLGLALANRLLIAMEGSIGVESTRGEGSCFVVTLQRA